MAILQGKSIPFFMMVLLVTINYEHQDPAVFKTPYIFTFLQLQNVTGPKQWHGIICIQHLI